MTSRNEKDNSRNATSDRSQSHVEKESTPTRKTFQELGVGKVISDKEHSHLMQKKVICDPRNLSKQNQNYKFGSIIIQKEQEHLKKFSNSFLDGFTPESTARSKNTGKKSSRKMKKKVSRSRSTKGKKKMP